MPVISILSANPPEPNLPYRVRYMHRVFGCPPYDGSFGVYNSRLKPNCGNIGHMLCSQPDRYTHYRYVQLHLRYYPKTRNPATPGTVTLAVMMGKEAKHPGVYEDRKPAYENVSVQIPIDTEKLYPLAHLEQTKNTAACNLDLEPVLTALSLEDIQTAATGFISCDWEIELTTAQDNGADEHKGGPQNDEEAFETKLRRAVITRAMLGLRPGGDNENDNNAL